MNEIRPLCLSFWTPPLVRPQSILIGKMIPEWIRQGVKPIIVTYDVCGKWGINAKVHTITQHKPNRLLARIPLIKTVAEILYFQKHAKVIADIVRKNNINVLFSFSNPQESNIIGAMVKRTTGVRFVSHFSDPWYDSPYKSYSWLDRSIVLCYEKFIINSSDRIVFTNEAAKKLVLKKFPEQIQKLGDVIPHCYDDHDYASPVSKPAKFTISHIGAFYKERNPEPLFRAVAGLVAAQPKLKDDISIILVGAANPYAGYDEPGIARMIKKYGLESIVTTTPSVSYKESLIKMKESDCLIVIDADFENSPFLPSKVVDYAGSRATIVGITPENSPTAKFLNDIGYKSFSHKDVSGLIGHLRNLITKGRTEGTGDSNTIQLEKYSVQSTTKKLLNIFRKVI